MSCRSLVIHQVNEELGVYGSGQGSGCYGVANLINSMPASPMLLNLCGGDNARAVQEVREGWGSDLGVRG